MEIGMVPGWSQKTRKVNMFLALKEFKHSKLRYTLIILIMIAIFLVFFVTGLANGLAFGDSSSIRNLKADDLVLNTDADGVIVKSELTAGRAGYKSGFGTGRPVQSEWTGGKGKSPYFKV